MTLASSVCNCWLFFLQNKTCLFANKVIALTTAQLEPIYFIQSFSISYFSQDPGTERTLTSPLCNQISAIHFKYKIDLSLTCHWPVTYSNERQSCNDIIAMWQIGTFTLDFFFFFLKFSLKLGKWKKWVCIYCI